jgi:hypothetical protein
VMRRPKERGLVFSPIGALSDHAADSSRTMWALWGS